MESDFNHINELIGKYFSDGLNENEQSELNKWLAQSKKNQHEFDDYKQLWSKSGVFQNPQNIDSNSAIQRIHKLANIRPVKHINFTLLKQIAAVLVLSLVFSGLYSYLFTGGNSSDSVTQEIHAAIGTKNNINLPDGSTVILNSGSSLRFDSRMEKQKERLVELKGEGYFKVTKNKEKPFVVKSGALEVKVLGTEFNVEAYNKNEKIEVALVEGKVGINKAGSQSRDFIMTLLPNEVATFDSKQNQISKSKSDDMSPFIGWINGKLVFVDEPIKEVVRKLENWYGTSIKIADTRLLDYRFTGTFINESLEEVLNVFSLTSPLSYQVIAAKKLDNGNYTKREFILKSQ